MKKIELPNGKDISIVKSQINQNFNTQREQTSCTLCGKEIKNKNRAFHKSHTVPFFCLENIKGLYKKNYGVLTADYLGLQTIFSDKEFIGTNKAGVFYSICSQCDQEKFSIYESEDSLLHRSAKDIVDSLALKIYLNELFNSRFMAFKSTLDYSDLTENQIVSSYFDSIGKMKEPTIDVDIRDFQEDLMFAQNSFENGYSNYRIIYNKILDYTVPIAAQASIPISQNVDFTKLQNVTMLNHRKIEDLLVCIFPLKNKSVIIVFYKIGDQLMKKYSKQFMKLKDKEKLREIFYLLIRYKAANYFFSPLVKDILCNENIRGVCSIEDTTIKMGKEEISLADFEDQNWKNNLPLLLGEEYSLQNLTIQDSLRSHRISTCGESDL